METPVGVVGAGVMGTGVAHNLAQYGIRTILVDVDEKRLQACAAAIRRNLRLYSTHPMHKESPEPADAVLARIDFSMDPDRLSEASIVIENVTEDWRIKERLYGKLRRICRLDAVVGVNTSAIPISKIAALMDRPENVLGAHFMNPVPLKRTVELIRGERTASATIDRFAALLAALDKRFVVVNDSPGFVTNRAMMLFVNEAIAMLQERIASADEIDALFRDCFAHKMGPLQTADLIGLDTVLRSLEVLYENFRNDKFLPAELLRDMVEAGRLGLKSGRGFFQYE